MAYARQRLHNTGTRNLAQCAIRTICYIEIGPKYGDGFGI